MAFAVPALTAEAAGAATVVPIAVVAPRAQTPSVARDAPEILSDLLVAWAVREELMACAHDDHAASSAAFLPGLQECRLIQLEADRMLASLIAGGGTRASLALFVEVGSCLAAANQELFAGFFLVQL